MIKGIIFDLDDTLYNASLCYDKGMEAIATYIKREFDINRNEFHRIFCISRNNVKSRLGNTAASHNRLLYIQDFLEQIGKYSIKYTFDIYNVYWEEALKNAKLYDYVIPLFEKLKKQGIKIAILSDLTAHIQYRKLLTLGIGEYINILVTSEEVGCEKPSLRMFDCIMGKMKMKSQEIIMIGDNEIRDIDGAKKAGIVTILYKPEIDIIKEVEKLL